MNIGERLRFLREQRDISGMALSKQVGVVPSQISKIENGVTNPSFDLLEKICAVFGITMSEFFADDNLCVIREKVIAKFGEMNLSEEQKAAAEKIKSMPIDVQQASFLKALEKFKRLSASDQEALIKIINSLPSSQK